MSGNTRTACWGQVVVPWEAFWRSHSNLKMQPQHSKGIHTKISNVPCQGLKTHQGINAPQQYPARGVEGPRTHIFQSQGRHPSLSQSQVDQWRAPGFSTPLSHPASPHTLSWRVSLSSCVNCWASSLQHLRTTTLPQSSAAWSTPSFQYLLALLVTVSAQRTHGCLCSLPPCFFRGGDEAEAAMGPGADAKAHRPSFPVRGWLTCPTLPRKD